MSLVDDFAAEIEADHHRFLLESGNLVKRRPDWSDDNQWTSQGYLARVLESHCQSCGTVTRSLTGVFHRETTPSGKVREQALVPGFQIPLDQNYPIIVDKVSAVLCPVCLTSHGFEETK